MTAVPVEVSLSIPAPTTAVWDALTRAGLVSLWWGRTAHDLDVVGRGAVLSTGTSSEYRVRPEAVQAPCRLEFTTSYLGSGEPVRVRIDLRPAGPGECRLRLREWPDHPTPAGLRMARELWALRLERLRSVLAGEAPGEPDEIVAGCPLREVGWRPLHRANLTRWLPIGSTAEGTDMFYAMDSVGARPFPIVGLRLHYDERLELDIAVAHEGPPTHGEVTITPGAGAGLWMEVRHRGWRTSDPDAETRQYLRTVFRATWEEVLSQAGCGSAR
ncbi:SRPBCC domain-containing protein [Kineosporia sp. NBRC 101731]|uniref:SRPBCC family protein n=1 Tax=Kineosporia sp. NBRC 101731 TaxID=3032199 RepID=UPI00249F9D88|nr:SRPBCC domain-containing protein [Kineosporia sp. NBRC 101731]GLY30375.1 hypothetical protein Kisp02_37400 [Kineosporia sp. NBRC 101731]